VGARLGALDDFKGGFREVVGLVGSGGAGVSGSSSFLTGRGRASATPLSADIFLVREP
jgi:hypothetical protein